MSRGRGHRRAVKAFDALGLDPAGAEGGGDVVGDVAAADRQRLQADQHAAGEYRDVGDTTAKLDQGNAQLAFLLAQTGLPRRDRRGDGGFDAEMGGSDAQVEVFPRRRIGGDDVDVDGELLGMEAARLLDAVDFVDRVEGRQRMEQLPALALDRRPALGEQSVDILVGDAAAADADLDVDHVGDHAAGGKADEHLVDLGAGDAFGLLHGFADRDLALLHVGDEAALDAAALALAGAQYLEPPVRPRLRDQRADLGRADVQRRHQGPGRGQSGAAHHQMVSDKSRGIWPGSGAGGAEGTRAPGSREMRT